MKSFLTPLKIFAVAALCVGGFLFVSAQGTVTTIPNQDFDLYGYACNPTSNTIIGCLSLNRLSSVGQPGFADQPTSAFVVRYNPATGAFSGSGWAPVVKSLVEFGQQCPPYINIPGAQTGLKCAKVVNVANNVPSGNGWSGYIYVGSVSYPVPNTGVPTGIMSGTAWEGVNSDGATGPYSPDVGVGRLDFGQNAFIEIKGCMDPSSTTYNKFATVNDGCTSTVELCTNEVDDNGNGTINEGCPEICGDGLDNDQDNPRAVDENPPCTGSGTGGPGGTGSGTGSGTIVPKYKER